MRLFHYQVTHGLPFEVCAKHLAERDAAVAQVEAAIAKYGATPGRWLSYGTQVQGLHFRSAPPGWVTRKSCMGYYVPNKKTAVGREARALLDDIKIPPTEELAVNLGCEPFFTDLDDGQMYCANVSVFAHGGTFYLQCCKWCRPQRQLPQADLASYGIRFIEASEWHKADEDRLRLERERAPNAQAQGAPASGAQVQRLVGCEQSTGESAHA